MKPSTGFKDILPTSIHLPCKREPGILDGDKMLGSKERPVKESFLFILSIHPLFILQTQHIQGRERILICKATQFMSHVKTQFAVMMNNVSVT